MKKVYIFFSILILLIVIFIIIFLNRPKVGNIITFGSLQWRVLDVQGLRAFIISEKIIEQRPYHRIYAEIGWEKSSIREYLQNDFIEKTFTPKEAKRIYYSKNITRNNAWYDTYSGNDTFDKVVLLTIEEVVKYFGNSGDLKAHKAWIVDGNKSVFKSGDLVSVVYTESEEGYILHDQYDSARVAKDTDGVSSTWWTRTPGYNTSSVVVIGSDGVVRMNGNVVTAKTGGVRPAMWIYFGFRF